MLFRKTKPRTPQVDFPTGGVLATRQATVTVDTGGEKRTLLKEVTLELTAQSTAVLGLNGSGKSTFLRLFNGLSLLTSGEVSVDGVGVYENLAAVRRRVGLLFSDPAAQLIMPTAIEDVELSLKHISDKDARRTAALEALRARGLEHRAFDSVFSLSGGEKQLVALAAVLAVKPKVLLLDEPTTLLDLRNRLRLFSLLDELPQQKVISTHDLELAARCERAVVIHEGRLLCEGASAEVIESYKYWCAEGFPHDLG
ncbi:MAG: ABC transporter ATP-binding protein [Rothia sp. (in: high G+C Gram-positive bacteria)]|nr:ABC transporter ATP-binding protein [Rothia sp. (in: high G+C Gram-positive bacteria)]